MKIKSLIVFALAGMLLASCDETTNEIGSSLTYAGDELNVVTDSFVVSTRSIAVDSVLSRNTVGYLGRVKDPETGAYITCDYMTQFYIFENYEFPSLDAIKSLEDGEVVADSCEIRLFFNDNSYGDSLATMKLTMYELAKPMTEDRNYYSNFDPIAEGYVREDGIKLDRVYTLTDQNMTLSERTAAGSRYIKIMLNGEYTDRDGKTYKNFGTYMMRKFFEDAQNYKNSVTFANRVAPGFYFKCTSGLGSMANIFMTQLRVYFQYYSDTEEKVVTGTTAFSGTEEVLQTTNITNNKTSIDRLINEDACSYLKTPSGVFTEATIPVDEILNGHSNDTINTAKVTFTRLNNKDQSLYTLGPPSTLLMVPKYRMFSFFENHEVADWKTTFTATYNNTSNGYTFNNIGLLIKDMNSRRSTDADWNKVVLIPVVVSTSTQGVLTSVVNDMSMTSTRLVGGANAQDDIKISIVYSKFK